MVLWMVRGEHDIDLVALSDLFQIESVELLSRLFLAVDFCDDVAAACDCGC